MFEFSVAWKYLKPKWKHLSVSIISLISILVISLVVWLIVVFFSVTQGLEKRWIDKLISLTAPIRITPTEHYYNSYYYLVDTVSEASNFTAKNISEKLHSDLSDPYNIDNDEELPKTWTKQDFNKDGNLKDPVKLAFEAIDSLSTNFKIKASSFEMAAASLRLRLIRNLPSTNNHTQSFISQSVFLSSIDNDNNKLFQTAIALSPADTANLTHLATLNTGNEMTDIPDVPKRVVNSEIKNRLENLRFQATFTKEPTLKPLWFYQVTSPNKNSVHLPSDPLLGEGILLPKSFKDAGVLVGDKGYLSYQIPTASSMQEQRLKVFVAGFYDQGLISIGGKFVLVNDNVTSLIGSLLHDGKTDTNGINVRFDSLDKASLIKDHLLKSFEKLGIAPYWKVETYREFEFTKDLIQQLNSDKHLFSLISAVIIIVACSNIISMLIILVNDKKVEIGILRSLGASSFSIATIFGFCGVVMGLTGSIIGILAAILTLKNLDTLVLFLSKLQGHQAFNPIFYGDSLPNSVSNEAIMTVVLATALISLFSGLIPAIKASLLQPSSILRAE